VKTPLAVVDTNVIVSGLINPFGKPGAVVDAVLSRRARLAWDDRIAIEYLEVLSRPRFSFSQSDIERVLAILPFGERVDPLPWPGEPSPDPADTMFLEVAAAADCPLVTGNLRHFPESCRGKVLVQPPAEWLEGLHG
jgi:predicted nucleic acid-binding protein